MCVFVCSCGVCDSMRVVVYPPLSCLICVCSRCKASSPLHRWSGCCWCMIEDDYSRSYYSYISLCALSRSDVIADFAVTEVIEVFAAIEVQYASDNMPLTHSDTSCCSAVSDTFTVFLFDMHMGAHTICKKSFPWESNSQNITWDVYGSVRSFLAEMHLHLLALLLELFTSSSLLFVAACSQLQPRCGPRMICILLLLMTRSGMR